MNQKVFATVLLLGVLALPAFAVTPPTTPDAGVAGNILHHPKALARFLHLSTDQATQLNGFWQTLETAEQPLRQARPALCQQLRTDLGPATPNPTTVGTDVLALVGNKDQIKAAREAFDTSFSAILNADQLTKYDTLKQIANLDNGPGVDLLGDCPPASS